jgi:hypothetical protein
MSIDGYLDTATDERLVLSNDADLDRVDVVRADSDAILVGGATLRNDNPRLLVRALSRRAERIARGLPSTPIKVTVTSRALSWAHAQPSSSPVTPRSWSTVSPMPWPRLGAGSGRSPRSSTAVGRSKCAGSARTCAPAVSGG